MATVFSTIHRKLHLHLPTSPYGNQYDPYHLTFPSILRTTAFFFTTSLPLYSNNTRSWFPVFTLLELIYHLPLTLWAIPALLRADPRIPLALLVFGLETSLTTLTCFAEMWSWEELTPAQRGLSGLGGMYGGYLALGE